MGFLVESEESLKLQIIIKNKPRKHYVTGLFAENEGFEPPEV
jgi:hypothetical protein